MRCFIYAALFLLLFTGCMNKKTPVASSAIIPLPVYIEYSEGSFEVKDNIHLIYDSHVSGDLANFLKKYLRDHGDIKVSVGKNPNDKIIGKSILLDLDESADLLPEEYLLEITPDSIFIAGSSPAGLFYGIQSLRQLFLQSPEKRLIIPCMRIQDYPRFSWRGMHLDVSRHFMPVEFIKEYIDYLAFLKMNVFHWHLVDDQGWRIEIKQYPKLTEIGAYRSETLAGHYSDEPRQFDGVTYGGYYTQEDIRDIVAYAEERFITIVPEIEIPGHSQAAIASYPELGCTNDSVSVRTFWGISPYIYNVEENTFQFLQNVLDEIVELFPSHYIHIGGDEALKDQWKASESVQSKMRKMGIADESELQGYFIGRIEKHLQKKGRSIIGWDEILEGGVASTAAVMSWRGTEGGIEAAKKGHFVVMTPTDHCYFDYYQSENSNEPLAIGGYLPLDSVYSYEPIPEELSTEEQQFILGVQGNVWTEYMKTPEKVQYMVFPRIFAMSEIQWTPPEQKEYIDFIDRIRLLEVYLVDNNINYAKHAFNK